jgi:hypothetical protein
MSISPYKAKKAWVHAKTGNEAGSAPMPFINKSGNLAFASSSLAGANGEINAGSKNELITAIAALQRAVQGGAYSQEVATSATEVKAQRDQLVTAALHDKDGAAWKALGEVIGDEVHETLGRQAFAHKTLIHKPLARGEIGRIRIRKKDVIAYFATRNPEVVASQVRQFYVYPPEYYLLGRILIEDAEIEQASGDLLDDKYQDGLEQILRQQDLVWKRLADAAAPTYNNTFLFNTFTPTVFASMQNQVMRWGIPVSQAIISFDIWPDIVADTEFSTWFDPVSKHEIVMNGYLGNILGTAIHTDGFRYETLKVLEPGEVYFVGAPETLGALTSRKALSASPINLQALGRPERGWFFEQIEGMAITNSRAIVKGRKF